MAQRRRSFSLLTRNRRAAQFRLLAITIFCVAAAMHAPHAQAVNIAYYISTDGATTVPAAVQAEMVGRLGADVSIQVINPAGGSTINGVPIRSLGDITIQRRDDATRQGDGLFDVAPNPVAAHYFLAGDLNLASNMSIWSTGSKLLQLEVGNNANLSQGSFITVSAIGQLGGAGGGNGANAPGSVHFQPDLWGNGGEGGAGGVGGDFTIDNTGGYGQPGPEFNIVNMNTLQSATPTVASASFAGFGGTPGQGDQYYVEDVTGTSKSLVVNSVGEAATPGPVNAAAVGGLVNGGPPGIPDIFGLHNGGDGSPGQPGGDGPNGASGGHAPLVNTLGATVAHLRGGSGGGSGATGGKGLYGGNGGGGGGGGNARIGLGHLAGGEGGDGGAGGISGNGGAGGVGGGGGGGVQLFVHGKVVDLGSIEAVGANGGTGGVGQNGGNGVSGKVPHSQPQYQDDLHGGFGGNGGKGGNGGHGGAGAGGAGGSIQVISSIYEQSLIFGGFNTSGGSGGADGAALRNSMGSTAFYPAQTQVADFFAAGNNPYRSYIAVAPSPNAPANGFTPNLPNVAGGAAPYGRLLNASNPAQFDVSFASAAMQGAPSDAIGVVMRAKPSKLLGANNDFPAYDLLTYSLRPGAPGFGPVAASPSLVAVNGADLTYRPTSPIRLKTAGYLNDPTLTPGATGPVNITGLTSGQTFATLIDRGKAYGMTAGFTPYSKERLFFGAPTYDSGTGAAIDPIYLYDRGLLKVGVDVTASGAAPQSYLSGGIEQDTQINPVPAPMILRRGAPLAVTVTASNIGNFLTTTSGVVQGVTPDTIVFPTPFSVLNGFVTGSFSQTFDINTSRGAEGTQVQRVLSAQVIPHYDDQADPVADIELHAQLYSPKWQTISHGPDGSTILSVGGDPNNQPALPFLQTAVGQNGGNSLQIFNVGDSDANTAADNQLSRMTVLGMSITGPDAAAFSLLSVPSPIYDPGVFKNLSIGFSPNHSGASTATLRITTDINAAYGTPGDVFVIPLSALGVAGNIPGDYDNSGTVDAADYVVFQKYANTSHVLPNDPLGGTIGSGQFTQWCANFGKTNNLGLATVPGDYDENGTVNAADYAVWRKFVGTSHLLPNDSFGGTIGAAQFNQWRSNFGKVAGQGASTLASVPEPASAALLMLGTALGLLRRRRK